MCTPFVSQRSVFSTPVRLEENRGRKRKGQDRRQRKPGDKCVLYITTSHTLLVSLFSSVAWKQLKNCPAATSHDAWTVLGRRPMGAEVVAVCLNCHPASPQHVTGQACANDWSSVMHLRHCLQHVQGAQLCQSSVFIRSDVGVPACFVCCLEGGDAASL